MKQRLNAMDYSNSGAFKAMYGLGAYLEKSPLGQPLLNLVYLRVSQINGCAFCLDMHAKDLRAEGESEQRIYLLDAWREAPFYTDREKAALVWAEALTRIPGGQVSDEAYTQARGQFSESELIDLTLAVTTINSYNRFNIAFRTQAGSYQPGQFAAHA
jgi:AhpD family alkylhydroperoxidase